VIPLARGRELCEKLGAQTFEVIEGGGHLVMRERPGLINQRIEELALFTK
jgi:pimeloyl-ACP methyl ester carboxylesterase